MKLLTEDHLQYASDAKSTIFQTSKAKFQLEILRRMDS